MSDVSTALAGTSSWPEPPPATEGAAAPAPSSAPALESADDLVSRLENSGWKALRRRVGEGSRTVVDVLIGSGGIFLVDSESSAGAGLAASVISDAEQPAKIDGLKATADAARSALPVLTRQYVVAVLAYPDTSPLSLSRGPVQVCTTAMLESVITARSNVLSAAETEEVGRVLDTALHPAGGSAKRPSPRRVERSAAPAEDAPSGRRSRRFRKGRADKAATAATSAPAEGPPAPSAEAVATPAPYAFVSPPVPKANPAPTEDVAAVEPAPAPVALPEVTWDDIVPAAAPEPEVTWDDILPAAEPPAADPPAAVEAPALPAAVDAPELPAAVEAPAPTPEPELTWDDILTEAEPPAAVEAPELPAAVEAPAPTPEPELTWDDIVPAAEPPAAEPPAAVDALGYDAALGYDVAPVAAEESPAESPAWEELSRDDLVSPAPAADPRPGGRRRAAPKPEEPETTPRGSAAPRRARKLSPEEEAAEAALVAAELARLDEDERRAVEATIAATPTAPPPIEELAAASPRSAPDPVALPELSEVWSPESEDAPPAEVEDAPAPVADTSAAAADGWDWDAAADDADAAVAQTVPTVDQQVPADDAWHWDSVAETDQPLSPGFNAPAASDAWDTGLSVAVSQWKASRVATAEAVLDPVADEPREERRQSRKQAVVAAPTAAGGQAKLSRRGQKLYEAMNGPAADADDDAEAADGKPKSRLVRRVLLLAIVAGIVLVASLNYTQISAWVGDHVKVPGIGSDEAPAKSTPKDGAPGKGSDPTKGGDGSGGGANGNQGGTKG